MDRILLVNDSTTLTRVLTSHFRRAGYLVNAVSTAMEAYQSFIRYDPDLILMDHVLSDRDGLTVVETFRASANHRDVRIVMFAATDDPAVEQKCKEAGTDLLLSKTSDFESILKAIDDLVEEHKSRKPRSSIDKDVGACLVNATVSVFRTMMDMQVMPGDVVVEQARPRKAQVIGSIGVAGFLSGSISVFMPRQTACVATSKMLMMEPDEVSNDDLVDAMGELVKMIGVNIKNELFETTPLFDTSVPSVYMGEDLQRCTVSEDFCFMVPFTYEDQELDVEFLMISCDGEGTTGVQNALVKAMS